MPDEKLTASFYLSEFISSQEAARRAINNDPPLAQLLTIRQVLAPAMQAIRNHLGHPVVISSGYRSPQLNALIGGAINPPSAHTLGLACDFTCPGFGSPKAVALELQAYIRPLAIDQLIYEGAWIHVGFAEAGKQPRGQSLTAIFAPGQKTRYATGIL